MLFPIGPPALGLRAKCAHGMGCLSSNFTVIRPRKENVTSIQSIVGIFLFFKNELTGPQRNRK